MGPKGSKRAPGGTAPGGSRLGRPEDGSIRTLGKPDLRGSTIMPPLRYLRQEGKNGSAGVAGSYWRRGEGGKNRPRMPGTFLLSDGSGRHAGMATRAAAGSGQEHKEHTSPSKHGLDFRLSRLPKPTELRLLPRPTPRGTNGQEQVPELTKVNAESSQGSAGHYFRSKA